MRIHLKKLVYLFAFAAVFSAHAGSFEDFFRAVRGDNGSGVRTLLNRGFDPNTRDEKGQTGLMLALREPSPKVIDVLLESPKTDVNVLNASDESPLMLVAIKGQQDLVTKLLARDAAVNKTGWTPLHYAASSGQLTIIKVLLDKYAFIDAQSPNGSTPLMMAAMYGSAESVKLLLDEGADPMMKNELGMTALAFAQQGKRPDAASMLTAAMRAKQPAVSTGKW